MRLGYLWRTTVLEKICYRTIQSASGPSTQWQHRLPLDNGQSIRDASGKSIHSRLDELTQNIDLVPEYLQKFKPSPSSNNVKYQASKSRNRQNITAPITSPHPSKLERLVLSLVQDEMKIEQTDTRTILKRYGYELQDLKVWLQLLKTSDLEVIAQSIRASSSNNSWQIPLFVLRQVVDKPNQNISTIQSLLDHLISRANSDKTTHHDIVTNRLDKRQPDQLLSDRGQLLLHIFHRLAVHIRAGYSLMTETLAFTFLQCIPLMLPNADHSRLDRPVSFLTNSFLENISRQPLVEPYKTANLREAAQRRIIEYMVGRSPPIELNRQGLRAVTNLRLASAKTAKERDWARLKSLSWPPWKHDRTAVDSLLGPEDGISEAGRLLDRGIVMGQNPNVWDKIARIYAGWDTDTSPTIQTRQHLSGMAEWQINEQVWTARIRTTRTLREAWSCFLVYRDKYPDLSTLVCQAMLEKIMHDQSRAHSSKSNAFLPGDGCETSSPPPSSHLEVYIREDPPSVDNFLELILQRKVRLTDEMICFLLSIASDWKSGMSIIMAKHFSCLQSGQDQAHRIVDSLLSNQFSDHMSVSVIGFLLKFPSRIEFQQLSTTTIGHWTITRRSIALALHVMKALPNLHHQIGIHLLNALSRQAGLTEFDPSLYKSPGLVRLSDVDLAISPYKPQLDRMVGLQIAMEISKLTDPGCIRAINSATLPKLLQIAFNALQSCHDILYPCDVSPQPDFIPTIIHEECYKTIKDINSIITITFFDALGMPSTPPPQSFNSPNPLPRLQLVPNAYTLHLAVRLFGCSENWTALVRLVTFIKEYWPEIKDRLNEDMSGKAMLRKTVVAIRLFLILGKEGGRIRKGRRDAVECMAELFAQQVEKRTLGANEECIRKVQDVIESMSYELDDGWPCDDEVMEYILSER